MKLPIHSLIRGGLALLCATIANAQQPNVQEHIVALKASLAASQAILKSYEWVETTVVSVKGEEKSRQMSTCYHGADGKVQKIPLTTPAPQEKKRGLRGKIAEAKTEEMTDYMKEAVALVKQYVPPDSQHIERAKDAGKVTASPQPGQKAQLTFEDYLKTGDRLTLLVDAANNRMVSAKVSTYLNKASEPVTLDVTFGRLENNATYASRIVMDAKAKQLTVTVENSGYRPQ